MTHQEIIDFSRRAILNVFEKAGEPIGTIYLFGSRFRGDPKPDSDWDFLVCSQNELPFSLKATIVAKIQTQLAEKLIPADIIIKSENKIRSERNNVGVITYYALKDGMAL